MHIKFEREYPIKRGNAKHYKWVDFYIPEIKLCIEVQGEYWHSQPKTKMKDNRKKKLIEHLGMELIEVGELETKDKKILKKRLKEEIKSRRSKK